MEGKENYYRGLSTIEKMLFIKKTVANFPKKILEKEKMKLLFGLFWILYLLVPELGKENYYLRYEYNTKTLLCSLIVAFFAKKKKVKLLFGFFFIVVPE